MFLLLPFEGEKDRTRKNSYCKIQTNSRHSNFSPSHSSLSFVPPFLPLWLWLSPYLCFVLFCFGFSPSRFFQVCEKSERSLWQGLAPPPFSFHPIPNLRLSTVSNNRTEIEPLSVYFFVFCLIMSRRLCRLRAFHFFLLFRRERKEEDDDKESRLSLFENRSTAT